MRLLFVAVAAGAAIGLAGCASPSKPGAMAVAVSQETIIADDSALRNAVSVGEVTGGKETNPLWTSEVANDDFAEALRQTLAAHAMLATEAGAYRVDAELLKLKQPFAGFNLTVTAIVKYTVADAASGETVFEETVETPYTAKVGDSFLAVERLRLANEGSIRENISVFIKKLIAKFDGTAEPASVAVEAAEDASS